jgi:hypothetical protein
VTQGRNPSDEEWDDLVRRFFESDGVESNGPEYVSSEFVSSESSGREASSPEIPEELNESSGELDEHFVPPEPRALGVGNPLTVLAWLAAAGGPLLLVLFAIVWRSAPFMAWFGAIALAIAGIGYLWWNLPSERNEFNNGAEL